MVKRKLALLVIGAALAASLIGQAVAREPAGGGGGGGGGGLPHRMVWRQPLRHHMI